MRQALCFIWLAFIIFLFLSVFPTTSFAQTTDNFKTDYTVIYTATDNGLTHAYFQVSLTNKTSTYYASSYKMDLGFSDIENLRAADPGGPVQIQETNTDNGKTIALTFNKKVIGKGNTLTFSVNFDTKDITHNYGSIREINIPGLTSPNDFNSFTVEVKVPQDFGTPSYVKPYEYQEGLLFTKNDLKKSGISIAFGNIQTYQFHLTYHLKNSNLFPKDTQIALPPSTNYQTVAITHMNPKPKNVTLDKDGNWLATYTLLPSQILTVAVSGTARLALTPKKEPLSAKDKAVYTQSQPYWQADDPHILEVAQSLKTPEAIYQYVTNTLTYDFSRVTKNEPRLGAVKALQNPNSAVCLEFTDLFIALSRAAGIPAREVDGFAQTENTKLRPLSLKNDILHAWPEYYDTTRQTWIMVDPTWGSTTGGVDYFHTLDFDHLAFVIKGQQSDYPVPAGGYKNTGSTDKKDVQVTFAKTAPLPDVQKFQLETNIQSPYPAGREVNGKVIVKNAGSFLTGGQRITILSDNLFPPEQKVDLPEIPPFGSVPVPFSFASTDFLTNHTFTYTIRLGQSSINRTLPVSPFVITTWRLVIGGGILVIFAALIFILTARSRRLRIS